MTFQTRGGVTFRPENESDVVSCIAQWVETHLKHISFQDHVVCIRINDPNQQHVKLDMSQFDPYRAAWICFYIYTPNMCRLDLLGGVEAMTVFELMGEIDLTCNLDLEEANPRPIYLGKDNDDCMDIEESTTTTTQNNQTSVPWIPIASLPRDEGSRLDDDTSTVSFSHLRDRIMWYITSGQVFEADVDGSNNLQWASLLFGSLLIDAMEQDEGGGESTRRHGKFDTVRMGMEKERLERAFEPYWNSEVEALELFVRNDLNEYMDSIFLADATPLDRQCFLMRHGPEWEPPTVVFRALMEHVPEDLLATLPVYNDFNGDLGGVVHLTYRDLFPWIWQCYQIEHMRSLMERATEDDQREYPLLIMQEAASTNAFIEKHIGKIQRWASSAWKKNRNQRHLMTWSSSGHIMGEVTDRRTGQVREAKQVADMEDLMSIMPPCFLNVMTQPFFLKNGQRWPWIMTMREAGVAKETVVEFLEAMNDQYPHESENYSTLRARFDYEKGWNYRPGDGSKCGNLVANALPGKTYKSPDQSLHCPMVKKLTRSQLEQHDRSLVTNSCKGACMKERNDWSTQFSGPDDLIYEALKKLPTLSMLIEYEDDDD